METVPESPANGKTMGDVLDSLLSDPRRWVSFFGLIALLCGLTILVMWVFTRLFGVSTQELRFGGADSHIVFQSVEKKTGDEEFVVIVNPEGWQKTAIQVRPSDRISFQANGKICIDLHEITEKVDLRLKYEKEWEAKENLRREDPSEKRVPEDYFTAEQNRSLILRRPWVGPEGFDLARFEPSFRSRRSRYLLPDQNAAGLVAAVKDEDSPPSRAEAVFVGRSRDDFSSSKSGSLWFTVNDVQYSDSENPNLFYNDNIGAFWVHILIKRK